jgi:hypothetical protein
MPNILYKAFNGFVPDWVTKSNESPVIRDREFDGDARATAMTAVDAFRDPGKIQPGYLLSDIDATDASLVTTAVHAMDVGVSAGTVAAYAISNANGSNNAKLFQITGVTFNDITNAGSWPKTISNVKASYRNDCLVTWLNLAGTQTLCLLYSYNLTTTPGAGRMGRLSIAAGTFADTQYTLSTGTVQEAGSTDLWCDRPMIKGTNGVVYIACGNKVDALDTNDQDPAIQLNVIDIPNDYKIKSLNFFRGYLVMVAQKNVSSSLMAGQVSVFMWDTINADTFQEEYYISAQNAGGTWATNDELYITTSNTNIGHLRKFNGQDFKIVTEIPPTLPQHHGIALFRDGFAFGSGANVYVYASPQTNGKKQLWAYMATSADISCVASIYPQNDILHVAGGTNPDFYIKKTNLSTYINSAQYQTVSVVLPNRSTIAKARILSPVLASGADLLVKYLSNYSDSFVNYFTYSFAETTQTVPPVPTNGDGAVTRKVYDNVITDVDEIRMTFTWNGTSPTNQVKIAMFSFDYDVIATKQQA